MRREVSTKRARRAQQRSIRVSLGKSDAESWDYTRSVSPQGRGDAWWSRSFAAGSWPISYSGLENALKTLSRERQLVHALGDGRVFDERWSVMRFQARIDDEGFRAAPMFVLDEALYAMHIV